MAKANCWRTSGQPSLPQLDSSVSTTGCPFSHTASSRSRATTFSRNVVIPATILATSAGGNSLPAFFSISPEIYKHQSEKILTRLTLVQTQPFLPPKLTCSQRYSSLDFNVSVLLLGSPGRQAKISKYFFCSLCWKCLKRGEKLCVCQESDTCDN